MCYQVGFAKDSGRENQGERGTRTGQSSRTASGQSHRRRGALGLKDPASEERLSVKNPLKGSGTFEGTDFRRSGSLLQSRLFSRKMNKENHERPSVAGGSKDLVVSRAGALGLLSTMAAAQAANSEGIPHATVGLTDGRRSSGGNGTRKYAFQGAVAGGGVAKTRKRVLR